MPEIPREVWTAVDARLDELPQPDRKFERDRWRMISREAVHTAAPLLAEAVAAKITAHMDAHGPQAGVPLHGEARRAWRRHLRLAAQVAHFAFSTPEDIKQAAIAAITRGDAVVCHDNHEQEA